VVGRFDFGEKVTLSSYNHEWYKVAKGKKKDCYVHESNLSKYKQVKAKYKLLYDMNLREGYTTKSNVIKTLKKGSVFNSTKRRGRWAYFPKQTGINKAGFICIEDANGKTKYLKNMN
jgi:uncharacterized protein YgiM (DUF1202 family)